jgi:hypothetical protein
LNTQLTDLRGQLAAKTKAFEISEDRREQAERRAAAMEAKVLYN